MIVTVKGEEFPANWTNIKRKSAMGGATTRRIHLPWELGPSQRTEVCGVVVGHALSGKLLHRFGPKGDEEPPSIGPLEDLDELVLGFCLNEFLMLDRSNDNCLSLVS